MFIFDFLERYLSEDKIHLRIAAFGQDCRSLLEILNEGRDFRFPIRMPLGIALEITSHFIWYTRDEK